MRAEKNFFRLSSMYVIEVDKIDKKKNLFIVKSLTKLGSIPVICGRHANVILF